MASDRCTTGDKDGRAFDLGLEGVAVFPEFVKFYEKIDKICKPVEDYECYNFIYFFYFCAGNGAANEYWTRSS